MLTNGKNRIVVTGLGPIASVGIGKEDFWQGIMNEKCGVELVKAFAGDEVWDEYFLHKVDHFDIQNFGIDQDDLNYIRKWKEGEDNKDLLFMLAAIKLALDDSQIDYQQKSNDLGLVVTHENPGLEQMLWKGFCGSYQLLENQFNMSERQYYAKLYDNIIKVGYETQSFMFLFHIARTFYIHEYSLFVNNACASGLYAIEAASDMIRLGKAKQVIIASSDCPDIYKHLWFKGLNMYIADGKTRPFSKDHEGFIMGEGATAFILEDWECAQKRGAFIYAEYLGGGFQLEGWGVTSPMIGGPYYEKSIERALVSSGVKKEEIDLVCAHGAGTRANDYYEAKSIKNTFSDLHVPVTALKPYVGHNLGGSTLIELAAILLAMQHDVIPPVLNTQEIDSKVKINIVQEKQKKKLKTILKTCSAFAGYNAATVMKKI